MAKRRILLAVYAVLLIVGTLGSALPRHSTDVQCGSTRPLYFSRGRASSGQRTSSPLCFEVNVPQGRALLTVALQPSRGEFDLYLASGKVTTLTETDHKLNFFDTIKDDRSTFAFPNPSGYYTIAVVPRRNNSEFDLTILTGGSTSDPQASAAAGCSTGPDGAQVCTRVAALTISEANDQVQIGSDFGDRVLFPIKVACPGKITATATWTGSARRLALIVNGPERPELLNPVAYYAREDGQSPLTVEYTVTSADVERGNRWLVSLVNFDRSGGTAEGRVEITYPDPSACPSVVVAPKVIDFDTWPDGRKITRTQILGGSEFSDLGITVAAAPSGSYCSDARAAVRVDSWASVPYLSTARPGQLNACNTVPVRIDFTKPVKSVTLSFIGAAETYTLTAYDSRGNRLGTAGKSGQLGQVVTVTYSSPSANIGRITFGRQAAVTIITAVMVPTPLLVIDIDDVTSIWGEGGPVVLQAETDDIRNFRVSRVSDKELEFTVNYSYNTDHGDNVFLGAYALRNGQQLGWLGYAPARVKQGNGRATIRLTYGYNNPPASVTTDQVKVTLYVGGGSSFYSKTFNYRKTWSAPVQGLSAPRQLSPANGAVFSHYPRTTTLRWSAVSGAAKYTVEIDCYHCCKANKWCTDVGRTHKLVPDLRATTYTFNFVGMQPGRWRVWAVDTAGQEGRKSDWREFRYTR